MSAINTTPQYSSPTTSQGHSTTDNSQSWFAKQDWLGFTSSLIGAFTGGGNAINEPNPQQQQGYQQPTVIIDGKNSGEVSPVVWVLVAVFSIAVLGGFGYLIFKK